MPRASRASARQVAQVPSRSHAGRWPRAPSASAPVAGRGGGASSGRASATCCCPTRSRAPTRPPGWRDRGRGARRRLLDNVAVAAQLAGGRLRAGTTLGVLIEVRWAGRCGVAGARGGASLARRRRRGTRTELRGLQAYAGSAQHRAPQERAERSRRARQTVEPIRQPALGCSHDRGRHRQRAGSRSRRGCRPRSSRAPTSSWTPTTPQRQQPPPFHQALFISTVIRGASSGSTPRDARGARRGAQGGRARLGQTQPSRRAVGVRPLGRARDPASSDDGLPPAYGSSRAADPGPLRPHGEPARLDRGGAQEHGRRGLASGCARGGVLARRPNGPGRRARRTPTRQTVRPAA